MPIYEYACEHCGHRLEAFQKLSDAPLEVCPTCGRPQLKKLISAAGFRLSGGGWYETDFKGGDKKRNLTRKDDQEKAKTPDKAAATGEQKPASKTKTANPKQAAG